jgi:hypothetical protein
MTIHCLKDDCTDNASCPCRCEECYFAKEQVLKSISSVVATSSPKRDGPMIVRCNWCLAILREPGALVFTPPDAIGRCTKIHVCVDCFKRVILSATPRPQG